MTAGITCTLKKNAQLDELHKFIEETIGRPVFTHELAGDKVQRELHEKLLPEINKIIEEAQQ